MDFMAIKHLLMKSRHKMLVPALILNITRNKTKVSSGYKTTFARNLHERVDKPVFTFEDAIKGLKNDDNEPRSKIERNMDEFFLNNLPERIFEMVPPSEQVEVDTLQISRYANDQQPKRKVKTVQNFQGRKKSTQQEMLTPEKAALGTGKKVSFKPKSDYALVGDSIGHQMQKKKTELNKDRK